MVQKHNVADILWDGPGGTLEIIEAHVEEAVSKLYRVRLVVKTDQASIPFTDMINAIGKVKLRAGLELDAQRTIWGLITRFAQSRTGHGHILTAGKKVYHYEIEMRPPLWLLSKKSCSRVFQKKSTQDIVSEVLDALGVAYSWELNESPPQRLYCVQYRESDFNFVCRLLEDDGIAYHFDHEGEKVVFCDNTAAYKDCTPTAEATYTEEYGPRLTFGKREYVRQLLYEESLSSGNFAVNDYFYETAPINLLNNKENSESPAFSNLEVYDHGQNFTDQGGGQRYAKLRMEEETGVMKHIQAETSCRSFAPGFCFTLDNHFRDDLNRRWLLLETALHFVQGRFEGSFHAIPDDAKYRPPRITPKPRVSGPQTATVTGPDGEEVYLDEMGRCKVQFHWDREGQKNDRSSMWVRVSNNYAGKDYGIQWIPRIGHEVLVECMNGDPDRPLVTGRVYNDQNTNPLNPATKYQNIIKTIKDNHIMFEDKDDQELVDIRAQRNMSTLVVNDKSISVGNDMSTSVGHDKSVTVTRHYTEATGENKTVTVGKNRSMTVGDDNTETIGKSRTVSVQDGDDKHTVAKGNRTSTIKKDETITVQDGDQTVTISKGKSELTVKKGRKVTVQAGDYEVDAKNTVKLHGKDFQFLADNQITISGKKLNITGLQEITLGVGPSTITINAQGVSIAGPKISATAIGIHEISGALIKLN